MKRLFLIATISVAAVATLFFVFRSKDNQTDESSNPQQTQTNSQNIQKQLNISILLDLSDRISPDINLDAQNYDTENIKTITEFFKTEMKCLGAFKAKGKIRIFLNPPPADANINTIVSKLMIDCSGGVDKNVYRKEIYDNIIGLYEQNLKKIYEQTIQTSSWKGSDIWGFFKDNVKDYCIDNDKNYRNILIIFTDGYLYDVRNTPIRDKNRYANIPPTKLVPYRVNNWKTKIQQDDFGFKTEITNLNELEILVLGVKTENSIHIFDADILTFLLEKWFKEMNVSRYKVYPFDLPANTKTRIENFLNQK